VKSGAPALQQLVNPFEFTKSATYWTAPPSSEWIPQARRGSRCAQRRGGEAKTKATPPRIYLVQGYNYKL